MERPTLSLPKASLHSLTPKLTLRTPIVLGVVLIVLIVVLAVLWIGGLVLAAIRSNTSPELFYAMLAAGSVLLAGVLAGVIAYLSLSVKAFQLNRRQSNFIDAVTHELKSPIASLKLYLQTMSRLDVDADRQREFHRMMMGDVRRLDMLIDHLLDAASIERATPSAETETFDLAAVLRSCAESTCARYHAPPQTVTVDLRPTLIDSLPVQVEILFRNLIDNAVKYGGDPPRVTVAAGLRTDDDPAPVPGTVTVSVCDNGPGIPANLRRKVFGRFVRLGSELERDRPGTGLGLYLVRGVTMTLGGRINVRDGDDGIGTRIDVTLPIRRVTAGAEST